MILALVLVAQVVAATPAPVATPPRKFSGGFGRPATTTTARIVIGPDDVKAAPTPTPEPFIPGLRPVAPMPVVASERPVEAPPADPAPVSDEALWTGRYAAARGKLDAALEELRRAERNVGNVVTYNGRPSQAHWIMAQARDNALLPYRMAVDDAAREVRDVQSACRTTTGCAPGWVR